MEKSVTFCQKVYAMRLMLKSFVDVSTLCFAEEGRKISETETHQDLEGERFVIMMGLRIGAICSR